METADELVAWFERAANSYGYASDTTRFKVADDILGDLNKIVIRAKELGPAVEAELAALMTTSPSPWVRYCVATLMMKYDRERATETLRQLTSEQGMFVPMCVAFIADLDAPRSS